MGRTLASTGMVVVLAALTAGGMNQKNALLAVITTSVTSVIPVR